MQSLQLMALKNSAVPADVVGCPISYGGSVNVRTGWSGAHTAENGSCVASFGNGLCARSLQHVFVIVPASLLPVRSCSVMVVPSLPVFLSLICKAFTAPLYHPDRHTLSEVIL